MTGHGSPGWRDDRPRPSEIFLSRLNAAADTDVTIVLRCGTAARAAAVLGALTHDAADDPAWVVGTRGRNLEVRRRTPIALGALALDPGPCHRGPFDVARARSDATVVIIRWSHLAGDARSCQELILDRLGAAGLIDDGPACRCVHFRPGTVRPMVSADAWDLLRERGVSGAFDATRAGAAAIAPMLWPVATTLVDDHTPTGDGHDTDAFAILRTESASSTGASHFARVAATVAATAVRPARPWPIRVGVTVDLRRHEPHLSGAGTAGNLSLVGWVTLPDGVDLTGTTAHARVQALLRSRFWRQQLAVDAWLFRRSARRTANVDDALIRHLADRAPVTVTELWRDDGPRCPSCHQPRRRLPADIAPVVIPPALPPAGLTVGLTRTDAETVVVLRRVTRPGISATAWIDAVAAAWPGRRERLGGPVRYR